MRMNADREGRAEIVVSKFKLGSDHPSWRAMGLRSAERKDDDSPDERRGRTKRR